MQKCVLVHCRIPAAGIAKDERSVCRKRLGWQEESALEPAESRLLAVLASVTELHGDGWQIEYFYRQPLTRVPHFLLSAERSTAEFTEKLHAHSCKWT